MITDPNTTTTFPSFKPGDKLAYTLDEAYIEAQTYLWSVYFGICFCWGLFACLCIQVFFYFRRFPNDSRVIRLTVMVLFAIEVTATGYATWTGYQTFIKRWGHSPLFGANTWGLMLFDSWVASIVHALYSWRIYKLITRRWLAVSMVTLIALLSAAQFACCVATALYNALQFHQKGDHQWDSRKLFHAWSACSAIADIFITATMAIKLYTVRTGIRATDKTINKILYVTVPGGATTAFVTLLILALQSIWVGMSYYTFLVVSLTKIYSNSVLLCLNLRSLHHTLDIRPTQFSNTRTATVNANISLGDSSSSAPRDVEKMPAGDGSSLLSLRSHGKPPVELAPHGADY